MINMCRRHSNTAPDLNITKSGVINSRLKFINVVYSLVVLFPPPPHVISFLSTGGSLFPRLSRFSFIKLTSPHARLEVLEPARWLPRIRHLIWQSPNQVLLILQSSFCTKAVFGMSKMGYSELYSSVTSWCEGPVPNSSVTVAYSRTPLQPHHRRPTASRAARARVCGCGRVRWTARMSRPRPEPRRSRSRSPVSVCGLLLGAVHSSSHDWHPRRWH